MKKVFTAIILTVAMLLSLTGVSASIKVPEKVRPSDKLFKIIKSKY